MTWRNGMSREHQTPAERAVYAERLRERERLKAKKRTAKKQAARAALLVNRPPTISKTNPTYRRRLPPLPGLILKSELRAFLAEAVRNTAP